MISKQWGIFRTLRHMGDCAKGQWGKGVPVMAERSVKTKLQAPHSAPNHTRQTGKTQSIHRVCPSIQECPMQPWNLKCGRRNTPDISSNEELCLREQNKVRTHTPHPRPAASGVQSHHREPLCLKGKHTNTKENDPGHTDGCLCSN